MKLYSESREFAASWLLVLLLGCLWPGLQLQHLERNELELLAQQLDEDDLDLSQVDWRAMIPFLLQRQQLRLCVAVYRFAPHLVEGTPCEQLLASGLMAFCDIANIEDLSVTMRGAFGNLLFDTLQRCRPGFEIFGVRCRRRA